MGLGTPEFHYGPRFLTPSQPPSNDAWKARRLFTRTNFIPSEAQVVQDVTVWHLLFGRFSLLEITVKFGELKDIKSGICQSPRPISSHIKKIQSLKAHLASPISFCIMMNVASLETSIEGSSVEKIPEGGSSAKPPEKLPQLTRCPKETRGPLSETLLSYCSGNEDERIDDGDKGRISSNVQLGACRGNQYAAIMVIVFGLPDVACPLQLDRYKTSSRAAHLTLCSSCRRPLRP